MGSTGPVAVVGATGFIGSAVERCLARDGRELRAYTRSQPAVADGVLAPGVAGAAAVVWLASAINPARAEGHPELVAADESLLDAFLGALERLDDPPPVVVASSGGAVYDPAAPPPYREDGATAPSNAYGRARLAAEQLLLSRGPRVRGTALRVANAYGPGQRPGTGQGVLAHWFDAAVRREPLRVFGSLETARDYVYVDDVADAFLAVGDALAAQRDGGPAVPAVLNVGSGRPTSLARLLDLVHRVVDHDLDVHHEQSRSFDRTSTWLDSDLVRESVGWKATTPLEEGVARQWEAHRVAGTGGGRRP